MTITGSGCGSLTVFDFPVCFIAESEEVELIKVIVGQLSASESTSKDIEKVVNRQRTMGGSVGGWHAMVFEFLPFEGAIVAEEGVTCDNVFA